MHNFNKLTKSIKLKRAMVRVVMREMGEQNEREPAEQLLHARYQLRHRRITLL